MGTLHKTDQTQRPPRAVEDSMSRGGVTYQLERVDCGKRRCRRCRGGPSHGPYWYAYYWSKGRTASKYVGKELPRELQLPEVRQLAADDVARGCSGRPGFVFEQGGPLPCRNVAVVRLVDRDGRPMCASCARTFERHCKAEKLPRPRFAPIE